MISRYALIASLLVSQVAIVASAANQNLKSVTGTVEQMDSTRADFTLFIKLANDQKTYRILDTNGQNTEMDKTIKVLQKSYNSTLDGNAMPIEIQYNQDLVIVSASVKN